jgi:NAD(P)-dependent dehydrogenase (short-subunit alcohol dehydrogenase family)
MARVLVTGSSDGLGLMAAELLAHVGHTVTLHARNDQRADDAHRALPAAEHVVIGDLASIEGTHQVAEQANALGTYDAVIHNAGIGYREPRRVETVDGLSHVFAINVLAPYLLTALIAPPGRLVSLSSGMHRSGHPDLDDLQWARRRWNGAQAYADSKLFDVVLAFAVARRWPSVLSNALEPGWVPTKMGGPGAPDDLSLAAATQVWLAVSDDPAATVTGNYFYHRQPRDVQPAARLVEVQDRLLDVCAELTGVVIPNPQPLSDHGRRSNGTARMSKCHRAIRLGLSTCSTIRHGRTSRSSVRPAVDRWRTSPSRPACWELSVLPPARYSRGTDLTRIRRPGCGICGEAGTHSLERWASPLSHRAHAFGVC